MLQPLFFAYSCGEVLKTPRRQNKSLKKNQKAVDRFLNHQYCYRNRRAKREAQKVEKPKDAADIIKEFDAILYAKRQQYNIKNKYF